VLPRCSRCNDLTNTVETLGHPGRSLAHAAPGGPGTKR
jgi:hypothetical protein